VGDCIILDKGGTTPEWGYVTGLTGTDQLDVAGGFSSGGTASGRAYYVIDYSNQAGCHAVLINGLDGNWATQREIVVTAGGTPSYVTTSKTWLRFNSFRVIATGVNGRPTGALAVMDNAGSPTITYTYITAGYTRARNTHYTVPNGWHLYVSEWNVSFVPQTAAKYCRVWTRAGQYQFESTTPAFLMRETTGVNIWHTYSEALLTGQAISISLPEPTLFLDKVDVKVTAYAEAAGVVTSALRGYLVQ